jgi:hypothetical protein
VDEERRELGPEMAGEGWILLDGDDIFWMHPPSRRCIEMHAATRHTCHVPCWGPEPADPKCDGYFVSCRVHAESGDPLYGDALWVESYAVALRVARRIRADILAETPAHGRDRKREYARRHGESWNAILALAAANGRARP